MAAETNRRRLLVGVVGRIVLVMMVSRLFVGLTVDMVVAVADVLHRQRRMALGFCEGEGRRMMRRGVNG